MNPQVLDPYKYSTMLDLEFEEDGIMWLGISDQRLQPLL